MIFEIFMYYILIVSSFGLSSTLFLIPKCTRLARNEFECETIFDNESLSTKLVIIISFIIAFSVFAPFCFIAQCKTRQVYSWALAAALIKDSKISEEIWNDILDEWTTQKNL